MLRSTGWRGRGRGGRQGGPPRPVRHAGDSSAQAGGGRRARVHGHQERRRGAEHDLARQPKEHLQQAAPEHAEGVHRAPGDGPPAPLHDLHEEQHRDRRHHVQAVLEAEHGRDCVLRGERQRAGEGLRDPADEPPEGVRVRQGEHDAPHHVRGQQRGGILSEAGLHQGRHDGAREVGRLHQGVRRRHHHGVRPLRAGFLHGVPGDDPAAARGGGREGEGDVQLARGVPRPDAVQGSRGAGRRAQTRPAGGDQRDQGGWVGTAGTAQVPTRAPGLRRRHAHDRESSQVHGGAGEPGAEPHRLVALHLARARGGGAGLLRSGQGSHLPGDHQGAGGERGVLPDPRDVRRGLQADVQQLQAVQRAGHGVLQERHAARGVL